MIKDWISAWVRVCVIVVFVCFSLLDSRLSELPSLMIAQSQHLLLVGRHNSRGWAAPLKVLISALYNNKRVKPPLEYTYTKQGRGISISSHFRQELLLVLEAALGHSLELLNWVLIIAPDNLALRRLAACLSVGLTENILGLDSWDVTAVTYKYITFIAKGWINQEYLGCGLTARFGIEGERKTQSLQRTEGDSQCSQEEACSIVDCF